MVRSEGEYEPEEAKSRGLPAEAGILDANIGHNDSDSLNESMIVESRANEC